LRRKKRPPFPRKKRLGQKRLVFPEGGKGRPRCPMKRGKKIKKRGGRFIAFNSGMPLRGAGNDRSWGEDWPPREEIGPAKERVRKETSPTSNQRHRTHVKGEATQRKRVKHETSEAPSEKKGGATSARTKATPCLSSRGRGERERHALGRPGKKKKFKQQRETIPPPISVWFGEPCKAGKERGRTRCHGGAPI